jgi:hypothetical protein
MTTISWRTLVFGGASAQCTSLYNWRSRVGINHIQQWRRSRGKLQGRGLGIFDCSLSSAECNSFFPLLVCNLFRNFSNRARRRLARNFVLWLWQNQRRIGIALALSLHNEVREATNKKDLDACTSFRYASNKLFGIVGGISLLTLLVNGTISEPLLQKLGLADSSETRKKVLKSGPVNLGKGTWLMIWWSF